MRRTTSRGCAVAATLIGATLATGSWAAGSNPDTDPTIPTFYPTPTRHYLKSSVNVCDQGSFFVGGKLKMTNYFSSVRSAEPKAVMIGQMYVQFQIPMKFNDYPIIFVSGGAHTGASLEPTPDGREGWAPQALRNNIPTFVVDQSGRGRSGFDATAIHEGKALLLDGTPEGQVAGKALIPDMLILGTADWWSGTFGHLVNPATGQPTSGAASVCRDQLVPHGFPADPDPVTIHNPGVMTQFPIHATSPEIIPPNLLPKGSTPSCTTIAGPSEYYHLNYWRELVPNSEQTLPSGTCYNTCTPTTISAGGFASGHTWTPVNIAELVEQLGKIYGGAIIATHSQGGPIGPHAVRYLKQHGTLGYLKGLITIEGTAVTLAAAGLAEADFDNIPFLVVKGDYSTTNSQWQGIVNSIIARRQSGLGKAAVEYIKLDESPSAANAWPTPFNRPVMQGITHMMMDGSDEGRGYSSTDIMTMIMNWSTAHITKMKTAISCTYSTAPVWKP